VGSKADDAVFGELTRLAQALDLCLSWTVAKPDIFVADRQVARNSAEARTNGSPDCPGRAGQGARERYPSAATPARAEAGSLRSLCRSHTLGG
jgi:hypothetical protein